MEAKLPPIAMLSGVENFVCVYCRLESQDAVHTPDCRWATTVPQVIAVLTAYERLNTAVHRFVGEYLATPGVTLADLKPLIVDVIRASDRVQDVAETRND